MIFVNPFDTSSFSLYTCPMMQRRLKIQNLCLIGIFTAIISIMAQVCIPLPLGVPLTMQSFAVMVAGIILGAKKGATATLLYLLIGFCGFPVFSRLTGGYQVIFGPTGGFLLSFPLLAFLSGVGGKFHLRSRGMLILMLLLGNTLTLAFGTAMFCLITNSAPIVGLTACVLTFLPVTLVQIGLAVFLGLKMRKHLQKIIHYE